MAITLPEYAKSMDDQKNRAIVELFPDTSDILRAIPFKSAPGGAWRYQREGELPTNMGFRAINEEPVEDHGVINDLVEQCFPMAGNIDADRVLVNRKGPEHRALLERMGVKRKTKNWSDTFIEGDNQSQPREYTGLKARLQAVNNEVDGTNYESRIVANSVAAGGGPLSLAVLDIAIGLVEEPTHIIWPKIMSDRLPAAARDIGVSGHVTQDKDEMGRRILRYGDLEILHGYGISPHGQFIPFNEVGWGGGAAETASAYIVSFREDGVCGLETSPMEVMDMGITESGVWYRTNVEHDTGICIENPYAAMRFSSFTNAPMVK